jgi:hypothetical protein
MIDETTSVKVFPSREQKKAIASQEKSTKKAKAAKAPAGDELDKASEETEPPPVDLQDPNQVKVGMVVRWWGQRQPSGKILAKKIEFRYLEDSFNIAAMLDLLNGDVKKGGFGFTPPNYDKNKNGLVVLNGKKMNVPSDHDVQNYLNDFGKQLVPLAFYQAPVDKPDKKQRPDPVKLQFRFTLVEQGNVANAYAHQSGNVMITREMYDALENEDQLAFILAHEIAHAVQRHSLREDQANMKKRTTVKAIRLGASRIPGVGGIVTRIAAGQVDKIIAAGYRRGLENQSDRLALHYMAAAGYDPRQGVRVWKLMSEKFGDQKVSTYWSSHETNRVRRSYLMAELHDSFGDVDFAAYQPKEDKHRAFLAAKQSLVDYGTKKAKK